MHIEKLLAQQQEAEKMLMEIRQEMKQLQKNAVTSRFEQPSYSQFLWINLALLL